MCTMILVAWNSGLTTGQYGTPRNVIEVSHPIRGLVLS